MTEERLYTKEYVYLAETKQNLTCSLLVLYYYPKLVQAPRNRHLVINALYLYLRF